MGGDLGPVIEDGDEQDVTPDDRTDLEILEGDKDDEAIEDAEEKPKPKQKSADKEDEEEEEKEEEKEDEEETEDEEDEEEIEDVDVPSPEYKDVMKKYPKLFKDFPGLRHDFFRVKAFDKIFASVDEAREISTQYDGYQKMADHLIKGDSEKILSGLNTYSKASMQKFASEFLPSLFKTDPEVHSRVVGDVLARILRSAQAQAKSSQNKNLYYATEHLATFLWDKKDIPDMAPASNPEIEARRRELDEREHRLIVAKDNEFAQDVKDSGGRQLRKEVARGIDPDDTLPGYIKEKLLDQLLEEVDQAMTKDEQHVRNMNSLWERAARMGYGKDFKTRLIQSYIGRARSLVGPIRRRLLAETMDKLNKKGGASSTVPTKKHIPGGKTPDASSKRPSPKDVDWTGTSDLDYLNRNIKRKK